MKFTFRDKFVKFIVLPLGGLFLISVVAQVQHTASAQDLTTQLTNAEGGDWSFVSIPDLFNADYADLSGGADTSIAAVFSSTYADGLIAAPNWTPTSPNSMNAEFALVLHRMMNDIAASTEHDPELALIAGDLIGGRWPQNRSELQRLFGSNVSTLVQELDAASASYYSWIRKLFSESGIDTVIAALGDHDIGDNNWIDASRANNVDNMKTDFGEHMVDPVFDNLSLVDTVVNQSWNDVRFGPSEDNYDEASYVYQSNNVLFVNVDVFRYEGGATLGVYGAVAPNVTGEHLQWVRSVLLRAELDPSVDHVIVQGHTPILGPVNANRSSRMMLEDGADSELWLTIAGFGTDFGGKVRAYLAGEVHATTTVLDPTSGVVQISHGALVQAIRGNFDNSDPTYLAVEVSGDGSTIDMVEYTIDLDRVGDTSFVWEVDRPISTAHDTYVSGPREVGSLSIDVSAQQLNLEASGSLMVAQEDASNAQSSLNVIVQSGEAIVTQLVKNSWHSIEFARPMSDPIVVMGPVTYNGTDPAHARVRNVNSGGFEYQIEEWAYLDGRHTVEESVSWIAVERGLHALGDGSVISAGSTRVNHNGVTIRSIDGAFDDTPIVFGQVVSEVGADPVIHRISQVSNSAFDVVIQEEESRGPHLRETFHYVAFKSGSFDSYATGLFTANHNGNRTALPVSYDGVTLADMQTINGVDTAALRILNETDASLSVFVEEEKSSDEETTHWSESIGWVKMDAAIYTF